MLETDRHWEAFGKVDPYFGVVSTPRYRTLAMDEACRAEFFEVGAKHVETVLTIIRSEIDAAFKPVRALDFGCGVGRLAIPLASHAAQVVGVDISPSMLAEAARNCGVASVSNVGFVRSSDDLTDLKGTFDFIHSFIVFQHIPVERGERLLAALLTRLDVGGVGALHFTYDSGLVGLRRAFSVVRKALPVTHFLANLARGRPLSYPHMQMNEYRVNRLLRQLQAGGCHRVHLRFTDHAGPRGVMLFFQKQSLPIDVSTELDRLCRDAGLRETVGKPL